MGHADLTVTDLPLGTLFPEAPYNTHLLTAIASQKAGATIQAAEIAELERERLALWDQALAIKSKGMHVFAHFAAKQYGLREMDFSSLVGRALAEDGAFDLGDLIQI